MVRMKVTAPVRAKATSSDVFAKLAKGECANFLNGRCHGASPCTIIEGEACDYFANYVRPLLDYPEFASKYSREAKISVALNPKSKVVRKRRNAELAFDIPPVAKAAVETIAAPATKKTTSGKAAKPASSSRTPAVTGKRKPAEPALALEMPAVAKAPGRPAKTQAVPQQKPVAAAVPAKSTTNEKAAAKATVKKTPKAVLAEKPTALPAQRKATATAKAPVTPAAPVKNVAAPAKTSHARKDDIAITTVVSVDGSVHEKPRVDAKKRTAVKASIPEPAPQLLLELTPELPKKSAAGRRR